MLLASARPVRIVADDKEGIPDNFTIFSASQIDQISSGLKEAEHGIFSYYLMKGLEGKADSDVSSYSIGSRSLSKMTPEELTTWRDYYKAEYNREVAKERIVPKAEKGQIPREIEQKLETFEPPEQPSLLAPSGTEQAAPPNLLDQGVQ